MGRGTFESKYEKTKLGNMALIASLRQSAAYPFVPWVLSCFGCSDVHQATGVGEDVELGLECLLRGERERGGTPTR